MGLAAATIGAAVIGGGASVIAGHSTASAARDTAASNNALTRDIYDQNKALETPYINTGQGANSAEAAFLGQGGAPAVGATGTTTINGKPIAIQPGAPSNPTSGTSWIDTSTGSPVLHVYDESSGRWATPNPSEQAQYLGGQSLASIVSSSTKPAAVGQDPGLTGFLDKAGLSAPDKAAQDAVGSSFQDYTSKSGVGNYNDAIDKFLGIGAGGMNDFLHSTGYQFTLDQGQKAIDHSNAAKGLRLSGAQLQDATKFAEGTAQTYGQQYLSSLAQAAGQRTGQYQDYTQGQFNLAGMKQNQLASYLGAQSDVANRGLSATNALAGVGTNMVGQVTSNNNNALQAVAGSNASMANNINGIAGNALGAFTYGQANRTPVNGFSGWGGTQIANSGGANVGNIF